MSRTIKTQCGLLLAGKETEQTAILKSVIKDGKPSLMIEIGDIRLWISRKAIEEIVYSNTVESLNRQIAELKNLRELDMSEIAYQRRQIDFLMEGRA